jgi:hypothetical protein
LSLLAAAVVVMIAQVVEVLEVCAAQLRPPVVVDLWKPD